MHQLIADATFRIECGNSSGSGFSFIETSVVVTNNRVIAPFHSDRQPIEAITEDGQRVGMELLGHSPENQFDFAILRASSALPDSRHVLKPKPQNLTARGTKVVFSGFPHGIHDLLTHEAIISGPVAAHAFYVDGSVNGGNSGGPVVDANTGEVVGIITQRRFLGGTELNGLRQQVQQLLRHCQGIANRGSVQIMGIDFGSFAQMMGQGFSVMDQLLQTNANSGIGIGFRIEHVEQECTRLGIES
ncbi:S1 family peptidase [Salinisphaera hydrothermalis]|uniref:S1 family peptidase n=1 Tax=Salinisphaera hydrothermalis TaxID=563188 RepID=UPI003341DDD3